jgi:PAS domain S-box-containing protein
MMSDSSGPGVSPPVTAGETEATLQRFLDAAGTGLVRCTADLRYRSANATFARLVGRPVDQIVGRTLEEVLGAAALAAIRPYIDRVLGGERVDYEIELRDHPTGPRWIHAIYVPEVQDGVVVGWVASVLDITERKRAEEALRRSQDHLRFVTDHAPVFLVHCDRDARYTFVNTPYSARFRLRPHDLIGRHISDVVGPVAYEALQPYVERALSGEHVDFELAVDYPYGRRSMYSTYVPQRDATGAVTGFVAVIQDVTSRRDAEETLRATDARFRATFDNAAVGIAHVGLDGRWLRVNDRLCEIVGHARDQLLGLTFQDITHPDDLATDVRNAEQLVAGTRASYSMDKRYIRADGSVVWVTLTVAMARDAENRPDYFISTVQDISARKAAESALVEADRRKDEFLAMLAHELRNPLAPIRTSMALMRMRPTTDPLMSKCRDVIERQVTHMARLLDDLLDVSRFSRGKLTVQRQPIALQEAIDAAIEVNLSLITQRHQHVALAATAGEPLIVDGDDARLIQVFGNLINNAAKYSESGAEIRVTLTRDGDWAVVTVCDQGIGIAPDMLGGIFELFTQTDAARAYAPGGMGIGLSLAERLVALHGGKIAAESDGIGRGATFSVRLPLSRSAMLTARALPGQPVPLPVRRRVLIVDDNIDVADTHAMLFTEGGCEVRTAYSGAAALQEAERFRPELVLLDIGLPDLSGYDVCRRLRALAWGTRMSVVAVTGWGQEYDRQQSAAAGFDRHLVKPVDPAVLSELVLAPDARS